MIRTLNDKVTTYQADIDSLDQMEREDKKAQADLLQTYEDSKVALHKFKQSIAFKAQLQKILEEELKELTNHKADKAQLKTLNDKLKLYIKEESELKAQRSIEQMRLESITAWITNFKRFKSFLANKSIRNIKDYTNLFLETMGSNINVEIEGYRELANKKVKEEITVSVLRDGLSEGSYGKFSGGERGRIDVCNILAIQELINLNSPSGGLDLLICDEIFDSIDSKGLECMIQGLQSLGKTIMIVSQVEINSLKEQTITVRKENKISTIV